MKICYFVFPVFINNLFYFYTFKNWFEWILKSLLILGLHHKCNSTLECEDGLICTHENMNRTIGVAKFMSPKNKLCLCDNENGYWEDVHHDICSGGKCMTLIYVYIRLGQTFCDMWGEGRRNVQRRLAKFLRVTHRTKIQSQKIYPLCILFE